MTTARLDLTSAGILLHRRSANALDEKLPLGPASLRRAAWAGLQDSMPQAAVLSIHARVHGTEPDTWGDDSLVQLWGPGSAPMSSLRGTSRSSRSVGFPTTPDGEIVRTWRRAQADVAIASWRRLSRSERESVETEAATMPLPGLRQEIRVTWND